MNKSFGGLNTTSMYKWISTFQLFSTKSKFSYTVEMRRFIRIKLISKTQDSNMGTTLCKRASIVVYRFSIVLDQWPSIFAKLDETKLKMK